MEPVKKENRKFDVRLLDIMQQNRRMIDQNGLIVIEKPVPDQDEPGVLDPRLFEILRQSSLDMSGIENPDDQAEVFRKNLALYYDYSKRIGKLFTGDMFPIVEPIKDMFDEIRSVPIVDGIEMRSFEIPCEADDYPVPVRCYRPEDASGHLPVFIYIHGGGFVGGTLDGIDQMCRSIAAKANCVVFSNTYRLSPEHKYPAALNDCLSVVNWVHEHASEYGGNPEMIAIGGDSAGANLADVCVLHDEASVRDGSPRKLIAQVLLYPVLNQTSLPDLKYPFDYSQFKTKPEYSSLINQTLAAMRVLVSCIPFVLGTFSLTDPDVSPYFADPLPAIPTLIILPEYDVLRPEGEAYAMKLLKNATPVSVVRYQGMVHGFADMIGVIPQAEDAMTEIASFLDQVYEKDQKCGQ